MNQDPVLKIELPLSSLNVIGQALGELPLKIAGPVMGELNKQISAQLQPPAPVEAPAAE
ncbi:hypothetical protein [Methylobacterium ajmalii]|uniref:hypothetical protein n=1 Tax=Methylobacterium ajmalii TaxID=2738439 RepID=UPI002F35A41D